MVSNERNNWIMPEIFQKIKETRFVIVDFSLQCNGAYYEAGYAGALWKNVIQLCSTKGKMFHRKLLSFIKVLTMILRKELLIG